MALCPMCGNETESGIPTCRFCGTKLRQEASTTKQSARLHKTINLERGRPFVEAALKQLSNELLLAGSENIKVLTVIHGYGSSGKGGKIRIECRKVLDHLVRQGKLNQFIPGEEFHKRSGAGKSLLRRFPELEKLCISDLDNPGITVVVL